MTNWGLGLDPEVSGIRPRQWAGLPGIVFAPLVPGGLDHLIANSPPLLVSITAMVFLYPCSGLRTLPAVWLGSGILVWLFCRESAHSVVRISGGFSTINPSTEEQRSAARPFASKPGNDALQALLLEVPVSNL